ncbi:MAG: CfrBI family restriction endonuclease, partial [Bacteroidota bacterium]
RVEKPLMQTLCKLYGVSHTNYAVKLKGKSDSDESTFEREIDFYLVEGTDNHKCEVKLMGKGNPESADAVIARGSKVFVADKLSETNKNQLDSLSVNWVELRNENGYRKFSEVLSNLKIPFSLNGDYDGTKLDQIFKEIF